MQSEIQFIPCKIERGGFTSERTFEIDLAGGDKLVGASFVNHLRDQDKQPLGEGTPRNGTPINGFVKCWIIRKDERGVLIEVPGSDVVQVPEEALVASE